MSASPIAGASVSGVLARISSIEARFSAERSSSTTTTNAVAASSTTADFGQVFGSMLGTGPLGATAVPWSQITGTAPTVGTAQFSSVPMPSTATASVAGQAPNDLESLDARPVAPGTPYAELFDAAGARHGVPPRLLASIGHVESRYQTDAVSPDGAQGVMQLMPFVSEHYGVDATIPAQAIDAAGQLLAEHHERFGSWELSVASYFSGAGAVSRAGDTPPTTRSHDYVRKVTERLSAT